MKKLILIPIILAILIPTLAWADILDDLTAFFEGWKQYFTEQEEPMLGATLVYPYAGGTGLDTSGSTGVPTIAAGTWSVTSITGITPSNWEALGDNAITPTTTVGIIVNASSTFTGRVALGSDILLDTGYAINWDEGGANETVIYVDTGEGGRITTYGPSGNLAILDLNILTSNRDFYLPDLTGTFLMATGTQDVTFGGDLSVTYGISAATGTFTGYITATGFTGKSSTTEAFATNPTDCANNQFAHEIDTSGNLACLALVDNDVPNTITVSNYLPLAGGTLTDLLSGTELSMTYGITGATSTFTSTSTLAGINADSGLLFVEPAQNRVGISTTSPYLAFGVEGNTAIDGTLNVGGTSNFIGAVTGAGGFVGDLTGNASDVSCSECLIIGTEVKAGTLTDTKYCIWDDGNSQITCDSTPAGTGDIESVGDCTTGDCDYFTLGDLDLTYGLSGATGTFTGYLTAVGFTGNASSATALATNPTACTNQFVRDLDADGTLTCNTVDIGDDTNLTVGATGIEKSGDDIALTSGYIIPLSASTTDWNTVTWWYDDYSSYIDQDVTSGSSPTFNYIIGNLTGNASTATAFFANPSACGAGPPQTLVKDIAADGTLTCHTLVDNDIPDTITVSNYLSLAGGTLTDLVSGTELSITYGASLATGTFSGDITMVNATSSGVMDATEYCISGTNCITSWAGGGDITSVGDCSTGDCDYFTLGDLDLTYGLTASTGTFANGFISQASSTSYGLSMELSTTTGTMVIPQGTAPVVETVGEMALDTTDNQLLVADSAGTARVIPLEISLFGFTLASTSAEFLSGGFIDIPKHTKDGRELTQFRCHVVGGTSVAVNVSDNGTNDTEAITCATTQTSDTDVATNDTFTADELWRVEIGTVTGAVDFLIFEAYGYITRE